MFTIKHNAKSKSLLINILLSISLMMISPFGSAITCDDDGNILSTCACDGIYQFHDSRDEKASDCCEDGENGINNLSSIMTCRKKGDPYLELFVCDDKHVTYKDFYCDGYRECADGSDESAKNCCKNGEKGINISTRTCEKINDPNKNLFACENMQLIDDKNYCNGIKECADGSDELASSCCENGEQGIDSVTRTCKKKNDPSKNFFVCKSMHVLNTKFHCNGMKDCSHADDEHASDCCEAGLQGINNSTMMCAKKDHPKTFFFVCKDMRVIKSNLICTTKKICADDSDKITTGTNPVCFSCGGKNKKLITRSMHCDGIHDCNDDSDEHASDCCEDGLHGINNSTMTCAKINDPGTKLFACKNKSVIKIEFICDGKNDCHDSSDEQASICCEYGVKGINNSTMICTKKNDPGTKLFVCKNKQVIKIELICDGENNCHDGSDEVINCNTNIGAYVAGFAVLATVGTAYAVMLVKYKNQRITQGMLAWLLSPIVEPARYLLCRRYGYDRFLSSNNDDNL